MTNNSKQAGKTEWAGRRRPTTRRAGFSATTAVELDKRSTQNVFLKPGQSYEIAFTVPPAEPQQWAGFGGWFRADGGFNVTLIAPVQTVLTDYAFPDWNKFGSLNVALESTNSYKASLVIAATTGGTVNFYAMATGIVEHTYLTTSRIGLRKNMWSFAPEANFYDPDALGEVTYPAKPTLTDSGAAIDVKSCNRCGRFLPVNLVDERSHLSFSNHCVAPHRRPCRHTGFGRISQSDGSDSAQLDFGFQLECRFCKKFEVNAAHNPKRTASQMKEDGTRRRHFELLLEHLYQGTPQLRYKNETGRDLTSDIYKRFGGKCFKCGTPLATEREMHLDHTRPLALMWPLNSTATALCATHNSEKRDRPPAEFYTESELERLARLTNIPLADLQNPAPNVEAIDFLGQNLEWFHKDFLQRQELQRLHDGKRPADLIVKSLRRVLAGYPGGAPFEL